MAVWGDMVALEVVARQQTLSGDHPHLPRVVPLLPQLKEPQKEHGADRYYIEENDEAKKYLSQITMNWHVSRFNLLIMCD